MAKRLRLNKKAKIEEMLNAIKAQKEEAAADSENESQTTDNDDSDESTEN